MCQPSAARVRAANTIFGTSDSFFFSSRRRHTRCSRDWSSDVCSSDLYPGDQWHGALVRMVTACRAYGLRAIDGPYGDFKDPDGFRAAARRAAALGYEGKWAIHPSQIALANEVFTPPPGEVERARRILLALDEAARAGRGAAQLDGRMIDAASARMAQNVVDIAAAIAARTAGASALASTRA